MLLMILNGIIRKESDANEKVTDKKTLCLDVQ